MPEIKFYKHEPIPMEMHKVKIVQQLNLLPVDKRLQKIKEAGFNTFQLHNGDIFMDMLTDSGVNAMSDNMLAAMMRPDDAYATSSRRSSGSNTCSRPIRDVPVKTFWRPVSSNPETASS